MKFTKIVLLSAFGVVLATIQMSSTSEAVAADEESRTAEDVYANYQQYYDQYAQQQPQQQVKPHPSYGIQNKQDFASDVRQMLGPEAGLIVGGAGLAVGLISLIGLAMQNVEFRGVCSATKALGDTSLALSSTTQLNTDTVATLRPQIVTQLNLIENAINNIATPSCTA